MFTTRNGCRICDGQLTTILDLGVLCVNGFLKPNEPDPMRAPLELTICEGCALVQLRHTVEPDSLYRTFWYKSSTTETMKKALREIVDSIRQQVSVPPGDIVVDIGSNDSYLLHQWPKELVRIGFEPAQNLGLSKVDAEGVRIVNDYFHALDEIKGRARVITAVAMFYDLENPNQFLQDVRATLADDGVFVVQMAYVGDTLGKNDFANVCHEHLEYYSLSTLVPLLEKHGLHPFDVTFNDTNGGSMRVLASPTHRAGNHAQDIPVIMAEEQKQGFSQVKTWNEFGQRVRDIRHKVRYLVGSMNRVYGLGASTKGNTMLQYWGLTRAELPGIAERDERKHGLETCGTRIPIISEEAARRKASTFLVNIWPFRAEVMEREKKWLSEGGRMIFPAPIVEVIPR